MNIRGNFGFIDVNGRAVIPIEYNYAEDFSEGLAVVRHRTGKWGYIDTTGREAIPTQFNFAESFSYGIAKVRLDGKQGCIDKTGKWIK